jgi:hypothetical protein
MLQMLWMQKFVLLRTNSSMPLKEDRLDYVLGLGNRYAGHRELRIDPHYIVKPCTGISAVRIGVLRASGGE